MSVIKSQFNYELNQYSPALDEYSRVVKYDDDGKEVVTYEKTDLPAITKSLGTAEDWSLNRLLKAGIDPKFNIHTSNPTRIESASEVLEAEAQVNALFDAEPKTE